MASWDATGRILPIWSKLDGREKREQLARLSDVRATELSAHNQGKPLGPKVAAKIVAGAAKAGIVISNLDLGAPEAEADMQGQLLLDRLGALEDALNSLGPNLEELGDRVSALEKQARPKKRRGGSEA